MVNQNEKERAIFYLMNTFPKDTLKEVFEYSQTNKIPDKWLEVHFSLGTHVKNALRKGGFKWDDILLERLWGELIDEASKRAMKYLFSDSKKTHPENGFH